MWEGFRKMAWKCVQGVEFWYYIWNSENTGRLNHCFFCWLGLFDPAELIDGVLKAAQYFVIYACLLQ